VLHVTVLVLLFVSTIVSVSTGCPPAAGTVEAGSGWRRDYGVARPEGVIFIRGLFYSLALSRKALLGVCWPDERWDFGALCTERSRCVCAARCGGQVAWPRAAAGARGIPLAISSWPPRRVASRSSLGAPELPSMGRDTALPFRKGAPPANGLQPAGPAQPG